MHFKQLTQGKHRIFGVKVEYNIYDHNTVDAGEKQCCADLMESLLK